MQTPSPSSGPRRTDPIEILVEASEIAANHTLDLDELLRGLAELVRKVVDYQLFAVLLRSGKDGLRIRHSIGYREEIVRNLRIKIGEGITGSAAEQMKTVIINDVRNEPRYIMAIDAVRSEIAVPLVARGKLVGLIDLQSPLLNAFGETEQNLLELIASRFSLAIEAARLHRATVRQNRTLRTLAEIAQDFSRILNLEHLLSQVSSLVRGLIPYDAVSIFLLDRDSGVLHQYFGVRYDERIRSQSLPLGKGIVGTAARSARPVLVRDTEQDDRYVAAIEGIRSEVAIPLMLKDQVIGVLDLESESLGAFTTSHVRTLKLLAPQVASAIENARLYEQVADHKARMEHDLAAARDLQTHLLPAQPPSFEGVEIAVRNDSATEVSGDLYDFFPFTEDCLGMLIGDVTGKGAAAALYAALAAGMIRKLVKPQRLPASVLAAANAALLERRIEARYLTALYAQWRPRESKLVIGNAGQPLPLLSRGGKVRPLVVAGVPLGLLDNAEYEDLELTVEAGDMLVIASDGISESEDESRREYGKERLPDLIEANAEASAAELLEKIFEDVAAFSSGRQDDDRTVIVIRITR